MPDTFDYQEAFQCNIGLLTESEQERLRTARVAIPGMGGVGGAHLLTFARQGFERFVIADEDRYELRNLNRQRGATVETIDEKKTLVMKERTLLINPRCQISIFDEGVTRSNLDAFLEGVDVVIDGLDVFVIEMRRVLFNRALQRGIPVITAGPIGFSTAFLVFLPGGPDFDAYFNVRDGMPYPKKWLHFVIGLAPALLHRTYIDGVSFHERRGPSSCASVELCAGVAVIEAVKVLLQKGTVRAVPYYQQFDAFHSRFVSRRLWGGNRHPLQRLKIAWAAKKLGIQARDVEET